jgi:hypothetical protein
MTINELRGITAPVKPTAQLTPARARIDELKRTKDAAAENLKVERERQKLAKAPHTITAVTPFLPKM